MTRPHPLPLGGLLITLLGALFFSTKAILVKRAFAATGVDAVSLLTLCMVFALPFYVLAAFLLRWPDGTGPLTKKQWAATLLLGLFGYYLSSLFDFIGLQYISAGLERLILFLYPTFAVLLNRAVFWQPVSRLQWMAMALTYLGIAAAFSGEWQLTKPDGKFWWRSTWVAACAVTYAIYLVGSGRAVAQIGANRFTAYAMLSATAGVFAHFLLANGKVPALFSADLLPYGALLGVAATVAPTFLLGWGLKRIGANNVAIVSTAGPVSTIPQAHWFLDEPLTAPQLAGTGLVVAGLAVEKSGLEI